jgi:hypothetical protein
MPLIRSPTVARQTDRTIIEVVIVIHHLRATKFVKLKLNVGGKTAAAHHRNKMQQ